jgi:hypothetical protein
MVEAHLRNQRVGHIPQIPLPVLPNPGKLIIDPYTYTEMISANVVFLPYMRVIKIPNTVVLIEANQKFAVSYRDISWHGLFLAKSFNGGKVE